ncbi:ferredoxin reductase [Acinetobacter sp. 194]|uniref:ferredoxin reductase n=1 Tax=Acinetobacter shaoyimingii TaxID=2715164 RepID=UPI00140D7390|nr:ferredoxin reductase [Acinetobacter shaoyimingii]NHB58245.1 ferredoxin reductase [Acinetobacter shaoyimingii]
MQAVKNRNSSINSIVESVFDKDAANFWLQKFNPLWSFNQALGKIINKDQTAVDTVSLTIQTNKKFKLGEAGQHHPVIVTVNGRCFERTYSLTQLDVDHVLLTVKRVDKGIVSNWLIEKAQLGDVIEFGQPYGDMLLPQPSSPLLLLAAGSGITPMYSLIKAALKSNVSTPIQLMYWVKHEADAAFKAELEMLAEKHANLKVQLFHTQSEHPDSRLNESYLNQVSNLENTTVYACGPSGFVSTAEQVFKSAQSFKSEAFSLSHLASDDVGFINVTLTKSHKTVAIPKGQSILVGLEQQNIQPTHGCRMGICNKCACNKAQGSTKNLVNGATNTEPGHLLKICVNSAQSDLTIDL